MPEDPNPPINKRDPGNPSPNPAPPKVPSDAMWQPSDDEPRVLDSPQDDDL